MTRSIESGDGPDPRVRAALATLATESVADHDAQFWQVLGTRLIAERAAPASPSLNPLERLGQADREGDRFESAVRPAVAQLAERADWVRVQRPDWRRRFFVFACFAVLGTVLVSAVWLGSTAKQVVPPIRAGRLASMLSQRLTASPYVLGRVDTVGLGTRNGRFTFVRSAEGSLRYWGVDRQSDTAYDVRFGTGQTWRVRRGAAEAFADTGLAPGPPDEDGRRRYLQDDELGAIIRTLDGSPSTLAGSGERDGRKIWRVAIHLNASPDAPVDTMQVIIDQRTRFPVEVTRSVKGKVIERKRFSEMRMASTLSPDTFQIAFPAGVEPVRFDYGFRLDRMPAVAGMVRYAPMTPGWMPAGYELATVGVLPGSPLGLPSTAGGDNPADRDVVSLVYRYRMHRLTVTTRRVTSPLDSWKDPFRTGDGAAARIQKVRLDAGRFADTTVELVTAPGAAPHLWGRAADFVFTVSGDLEPSQVLRVANSLN